MIRKFFLLLVWCAATAAVEASLTTLIDGRWLPDLMLLTVIFLTLSVGFRYGFAAALAGGILKESFVSLGVGTVILPYLCAAFITDDLKRRLSIQESVISRLGVVFVCVLVQIVIQAVLFMRTQPVDWLSASAVIGPQTAVTLIFAETFFNICRPCALNSFAS